MLPPTLPSPAAISLPAEDGVAEDPYPEPSPCRPAGLQGRFLALSALPASLPAPMMDLQATVSLPMLVLGLGCFAVAAFGALASSSLAVYSPTKLEKRLPPPLGEQVVDELDQREREYRVVARFYLVGGLVAALLSLQQGVDQDSAPWALSLLVAFALLMCGSLPTAIADAQAERTILSMLPILRTGWRLLRWPLVLPVLGLTSGLLRAFRIREDSGSAPEEIAEEVMAAVADSVDEDALADEEKAWIGNIVGLKDLQVSTIMTPRPDILALTADLPLKKAVQFALEHGFSRYPVYRDKIDEITGLFFVKDALRLLQDEAAPEQTVESMMRQPLFVPESMAVPQLLRRLQADKVHLAVVLDEYGTTAGIVSVEDVLEEIVGEIEDEYDDEPALAQDQVDVVKQGQIVEIPGRLPVEELNHLLDLELPEDGDWETIAGFVIHSANRIPAPQESLRIEGVDFTVLRGDERRIERLRVAVPEDAGLGDG
jgi:putative hemolysin